MNRLIRIGSFFPGFDSSPELASTAAGRAASIMAATFPPNSPPASTISPSRDAAAAIALSTVTLPARSGGRAGASRRNRAQPNPLILSSTSGPSALKVLITGRPRPSANSGVSDP